MIELRVEGRVQATPMSCWWTCMAMVLEYYGRDYQYPWQYRAEFRRPPSLGTRPDGDFHYPTVDEGLAVDGALRAIDHLVYLQPYEWYERGVPADRGAFTALSTITEFRGLPSRPAFGEWTAADVEERLRAHGPFIFLGSWNGFPHAIVVTGLLTDTDRPQVVVIDPNLGFAQNWTLDGFNKLMSQRMERYNFDRLNPMYLPQPRQVLGVVVDQPAGATA
jgi:hypothetical protein